jgi:TRAP-type C4-dicarboxylate transport system permease small subunit
MFHLNEIKKYILKIGEILANIFFIIMIVSLILQVIFRYFLKLSVPWTEELARFSIIWTVFLGTAIAFHDNEHIRVTVFSARIKSFRIKKYYNYLILFIITIFVSASFYGGIKILEIGWKDWATTIPIKMGFVYISLPISMFIIIFFVFMKILNNEVFKD